MQQPGLGTASASAEVTTAGATTALHLSSCNTFEPSKWLLTPAFALASVIISSTDCFRNCYQQLQAVTSSTAQHLPVPCTSSVTSPTSALTAVDGISVQGPCGQEQQPRQQQQRRQQQECSHVNEVASLPFPQQPQSLSAALTATVAAVDEAQHQALRITPLQAAQQAFLEEQQRIHQVGKVWLTTSTTLDCPPTQEIGRPADMT